ncbi:hypothetical protein GCM10010321_02890 [Streptomyces chartreusis]|nr:hypothetical protein GCM10010321_02890 [Streptomyces chartreusis]
MPSSSGIYTRGLTSALSSLAVEFTGPALSVRRHVASDPPSLGENTELVLYRVAQESLTNTARHAGATRVDLTLEHTPDAVELRVRDNGRGIDGTTEGSGIQGMRERALLIGASRTLGPSADGGTQVRLTVPTRHRHLPRRGQRPHPQDRGLPRHQPEDRGEPPRQPAAETRPQGPPGTHPLRDPRRTDRTVTPAGMERARRLPEHGNASPGRPV